MQLLAGTEDDPRSPEPALVGQVRRATSLPIRVMLRLREGYGTDGGELVRLQGLIGAYRAVGADGVVLGFLNAHTEVDVAGGGRAWSATPISAGPSTGRSTPASRRTGPGGSCAGCPGSTRC